LGNIGGISFGKSLLTDILLDLLGMLDVIDESRIEIFRCEVGEGLQERGFGMIQSERLHDGTHGDSGASNTRFPTTDLFVPHDVLAIPLHRSHLLGRRRRPLHGPVMLRSAILPLF
jgi:hypothetical protein